MVNFSTFARAKSSDNRFDMFVYQHEIVSMYVSFAGNVKQSKKDKPQSIFLTIWKKMSFWDTYQKLGNNFLCTGIKNGVSRLLRCVFFYVLWCIEIKHSGSELLALASCKGLKTNRFIALKYGQIKVKSSPRLFQPEMSCFGSAFKITITRVYHLILYVRFPYILSEDYYLLWPTAGLTVPVSSKHE